MGEREKLKPRKCETGAHGGINFKSVKIVFLLTLPQFSSILVGSRGESSLHRFSARWRAA
jgi:hypothetical protein